MKSNQAAAVIILLLLLAGAIIVWQKLHSAPAHPGPAGQLPPVHVDRARAPAVEQDNIAVYFSPRGGCEQAVVEQINAAQKTIDMQAYSFTSHAIATALSDAQARGVRVRAILDYKDLGGQDRETVYLYSHHVATYTDAEHPIAHNKVIIIDARTIITGSFNFTNQAEKSNAENLLILTDKLTLADGYERNFEEHLGHSQVFEGVVTENNPRRRSPAAR